jgi:hypothetical protein
MRGRRRVSRSVDEVIEELEELLRRAYPDSCFPKVGEVWLSWELFEHIIHLDNQLY